MKNMLLLTLYTVVLLLGSCTEQTARPPVLKDPEVKVSKTTASADEYVDITVTGAVRLEEPNAFEQAGYPGLILGVCLIPSDQLVDTEDIGCESFTLPEGFEVEGSRPLSTERDVIVTRGETVTLTHDIKLRSVSPQGVTLVGYYAFRGEELPKISDIYSRRSLRAFIRFE